MVNFMLQEKGMPKYFWAEAINTAVYIPNRTPTKAVLEFGPCGPFSKF
jgi:hypothetical protein